ncbi:hypothetical protein BK750_20015 [Bacillus thuringiensis serovar jegathesan]|uniref:Uncharacterized protein n=2 Tax=Bacillus TaxID=1386 RepID=A0A9X6M125_BACTJ|nr:hypothetical protein BK750_20015 [Bacillus thuringiensis serovar jegathesan]
MKGEDVMSVYDDEILRELKVNGIYTEGQIRDFINFSNRNNIVITEKENNFNVDGDIKFQVIEIYEGYLHGFNGNNLSASSYKIHKLKRVHP